MSLQQKVRVRLGLWGSVVWWFLLIQTAVICNVLFTIVWMFTEVLVAEKGFQCGQWWEWRGALCSRKHGHMEQREQESSLPCLQSFYRGQSSTTGNQNHQIKLNVILNIHAYLHTVCTLYGMSVIINIKILVSLSINTFFQDVYPVISLSLPFQALWCNFGIPQKKKDGK